MLDLAAQGFTYHEVGARLFISESTVRFHIQNLKSRFDARSKTDLIAKAIQAGFVQPPDEQFPGSAWPCASNDCADALVGSGQDHRVIVSSPLTARVRCVLMVSVD